MIAFDTTNLDIATSRSTLKATLYRPKQINSAVMIAPATGIKRQFYHAFAEFLAAHGYAVISFDNEGIGDSRHGQLAMCTASLVSWGQVDMPAVLQMLSTLVPDTHYHLIGHSAGGQLFGLMSNHSKLKSVFNVGASSGSLKNMALAYRIKAEYFMNVYIPLNNRLFGYTKTKAIGMGENLPKQVANQWRRWCNGSGYIQTELDNIDQHYYDQICLPSLWLHASDDDIATLSNVKQMIAVFDRLQADIMTLNPNDYHSDHIGHMKFFSRQNRHLWRIATDWLARCA